MDNLEMMQLLFSKLDEKLKQQTLTITTSVTKNVLEAMDEKIKTMMEENTMLKSKTTNFPQNSFPRLPTRLVPAGALDQNPPAKRCETFKIGTLNTKTFPRRLVTAEEYDHNPPQGYEDKTQLKNNIIYICTYNVRSLLAENRLPELDQVLDKIKYDIIGLSEVKIEGIKIEQYRNYILMYRGDKSGSNGVGFIVNSNLKKNIIDFTTYSDRVVRLDIQCDTTVLNIIQAYAPIERAKEEAVERFYNQVTQALSNTGKHVIILGDFNSKIGLPLPEEHKICGQYGYGERNERGERLLQFCYTNKFVISNTIFKKPQKRKWTWLSPNGKTKNEIDFILIKDKRFITNFEILSPKFPSDHRMLRISYKLQQTKKKRKFLRTKNKTFLPIESNVMGMIVTRELAGNPTTENINNHYKTIVSAIQKSTSYLPTNAIKKDQDCNTINNNILKLINEREKLKNTWPRSDIEKKRLKKLYRKIKKKIIERKNKIKMKLIESELETRGSTKNSQKSYKKEWMHSIKTKSGETITNRQSILLSATDFYKKLYSENQQTNPVDLNINQIHDQEQVPCFLLDEVESAISRMKKNKSPGEDGITTDMLIATAEQWAPHLTNIFNKILEREKNTRSLDTFNNNTHIQERRLQTNR
ncbi:unnamed protein product [Pieris macdunnoughi]|uniref:Endonuclease/exonuclease/phosphatase domain-containing protein n=1 Tax=Pieris macdunnoughi TaxID=345717 RepID=A0A821SFV1_9NEOP|nr:unnamed protein product [Pieris macdunnoughi]